MAVPVVRRQMLSEPPRLVVTILAVAASHKAAEAIAARLRESV